jgi:hypothetical protein
VPATATATITGGADDDLEIFTDLVTANGQMGMWSDLVPSTNNPRPWAGLSTAAMMSSDFHGLFVFASEADGTGDFRVALKYVGPVADQALVLGSPLSVPASSQVATGAYPRFRFQGPLPTEYNKGVFIELLSPEESGNYFSILATGAYLATSGNAQAYDITMPDVAGLAGFPVAARLISGANDVVVDGFGFSGQDRFHLRPVVGGEFRAANRHFTLIVP